MTTDYVYGFWCDYCRAMVESEIVIADVVICDCDYEISLDSMYVEKIGVMR